MATATTKRRRKTAKRPTVKKTLTNLNTTLINTSEDLIENSVLTGEKYQKLFVKSVKKTEPIIEKNVDIVFDTLEGLKDQFDYSTVRFKKLIGWNDKTLKNWRKNATKSIKSFRKNAEEKIESVQEDITARTKSIPTPSKTKRVAKKTASRKAKVVAKKVATKVTDLKVIDGIGPKMEQVLMSGGIKTVAALAKSTVTRIEKVIAKSGSNFRAINPESWVAQAKKMA